MIRILGSIPVDVTVALSGGPDSVALLDFLLRGRKNVKAAYFHHGTEHADKALGFVRALCEDKGVPLDEGFISECNSGKKSQEEHWRDERYRFLETLPGTIVTGHHLDDAVEWWIFSSLHGSGKLIPYRRGRVIRPLLLTPKSSLSRWCMKRDVPYILDPGNKSEKYMRSIIRNSIVPSALKVNPGLRTVLKKKIQNEFEEKGKTLYV